jgi:regulator of protease activity HflC (stomatin/prohibitin superfamily)
MSQPSFRFDFTSAGRTFKRLLLGGVLLIALVIFSMATITRIDPAHVGIRVKLAGSDRGVQDIPVVTGWVFFNPLTEQIIEFPTSIQNVVWTASAHEGAPHDESITFSSSEGVNVSADIGLSFSIDPARAPHLYLRFRKTDLMELANGYVRNAVREAFNDAASRMPVQEIYGAGKHKLAVAVTQKLTQVLGPDGFLIAQLTINGALRLPENVAQAINRAMEATQNAIQAENRVRQVRAEAEQAIAQSHGQAEAARQRAQGEADAVLIRARADAKANEIIRLSATGTVLQWRALERWDGKLPVMQSGDKMPMLTFDVSKLATNDAAREKRLRELFEETAPKPAEAPEATPAEAAKPLPGKELPPELKATAPVAPSNSAGKP